ncbi:MAG TPA: glutaredoxin family protein [Crenotrichaceae bacterium]|nr:glutaredoxin family protein [Crenotrichaceae bacterium]
MQSINSKFILYGTEGCHLCDEARDLVDLVLATMTDQLDYPTIDIADDAHLVEQYGTSIPVLKAIQLEHALYWPFDAKQINEFIRKL